MASISFLYGSCYTHDSGWTEDKNWSSGDDLYLSTEGNGNGANNLITLQLDAQPSEAITAITIKVAVKRHNLLLHRLTVTGYLYLEPQKPNDANVPSGYIASASSDSFLTSSAVITGAEMTFSNLNIPGDIKYIYVKCYSDEDELNYIEMDHWQDDISCSATQRYCSLVYDINCEGGAGTLPAQQSIIYGGTAEVDTLSTITREGYSFSGWDRSAKAIYPEFLKKDTSQIVMDDDYVLYAVWRPLFSWNLKNLNEMNTLIGYINNYLNLTVSIINSDDYYKAEVYNNLNALLLGNQQVAQGELITLEQMNELMNLYNNFM